MYEHWIDKYKYEKYVNMCYFNIKYINICVKK